MNVRKGEKKRPIKAVHVMTTAHSGRKNAFFFNIFKKETKQKLKEPSNSQSLMTAGIAHETPSEGPWHLMYREKIQIPEEKDMLSLKSCEMIKAEAKTCQKLVL